MSHLECIKLLRRAPGLLAFALAAIQIPRAQAQQPPPSVLVAEARSEQIHDQIEAIGTLRAKESVELTATVGERVVGIGFSDGDRVRAGQVLLRLSTDEVQAQLTEAKVTADEARKQFERAKQLANRGATAASQLDEARREFETARARVTAMQSRLANLVITAPFDGVVGLRNISVGAVVRPGDLITTLDDDSVMLLDFSVPEIYLSALQPGAEIEAQSQAFGGKVFRGKVRSLDSRIEPGTRSVLVRAEIENSQRQLKPGMLMIVNLRTNTRQATLIPETAVLPVGENSFALVIKDDKPDGLATVERRRIRIGARREGEVEVTEGISPGERVVTHGAFRVAEGSPVRITQAIRSASVGARKN